MDLMADCAICLAVNVMKAQPVETELRGMGANDKRTQTSGFSAHSHCLNIENYVSGVEVMQKH